MTRRPTYEQMCAEAISSLARRKGSSAHAIAKLLESRYGSSLPQASQFRRLLSRRLKHLVTKSLLLKNKVSYKLTPPVRRRLLSKSRHYNVARSHGASINRVFDDASEAGNGSKCGGLEVTVTDHVSHSSLKPSSCSISPSNRRRALLKQVLLSLSSMMMTKAMTACTHSSLCRRRLRRYGASLLCPI